ncbi:MAG: hypothetical protein MZV70_08150 [Desulfobacterales bacterium]|nr:hypothetical protein [Desulfobacterales bacterium]
MDALDLDVRAGECFGLLGPNGAGQDHHRGDDRGPRAPPTAARWRSWACAGAGTSARCASAWAWRCRRPRLAERLKVIEVIRLFRSFYATGHDPEEIARRGRAPGEERTRGWRSSPGGQQPAPGHRLRAGGRPRPPLPRRAHHGARSRSRAASVWDARRGLQGPGRDRAAHHPLHGRGRAALRPHRRHGPRPRHRAGHAPRAHRDAGRRPRRRVRPRRRRGAPARSGAGRPPGRGLRATRRAPLEPHRDRAPPLASGAHGRPGAAGRRDDGAAHAPRDAGGPLPEPHRAAPEGLVSAHLRPLLELTLARLREQFRQPEMVFWVFAFPVLLAMALGLAFRNRPPEVVHVAVEAGAGADTLAALLDGQPGFDVSVISPGEAAERLRTGRAALVLVAGDSLTYRYDPSRSGGRLARARHRRRAAAGRWGAAMPGHPRTRRSPSAGRATSTSSSRGSWGSTSWARGCGDGLRRGGRAPAQAHEAPGGLAHAPEPVPALVHRGAAGAPGSGGGAPRGLRRAGVRRARARIVGEPGPGQRRGRHVLRRHRPPHREPGADGGGGLGAHEPRSAPHVGALGGVLLRGELPRGHAAVHRRASSHGAQRSAPRHHDRRRVAGGAGPLPGDLRGVGRRLVRRGAQAVPLAVALTGRRAGSATSSPAIHSSTVHTSQPKGPSGLPRIAIIVLLLPSGFLLPGPSGEHPLRFSGYVGRPQVLLRCMGVG